ncbi:MAG: class I SAM-dependent methyltransferase [Fibrella sp.]|nr:class I SAM-dependent methyltransferase [Armatimonadota bacterium]
MKRIQFMELEDQEWLPEGIRDAMTDYLQAAIRVGRAYNPILPRLKNALDENKSLQIVDLCSGGGGPWSTLLPELPAQVTVRLTDRYPNESAFRHLQTGTAQRIRMHPDPVDATAVPDELVGFRTLFSSFHHFTPGQAHSILCDTVGKKQGIGIFEATHRSLPAVLIMLLTPLLVLLLTPSIRPFRLSRILWTYLIPIVPLFVLFDGIVSCLRTYTPDELQSMVSDLPPPANDYHWEIGEERPKKGVLPITYLIGYPLAR